MQKRLVFRGGCDLTFVKPEYIEHSPCLSTRYDAGICKHRKERVGVIEIYELSKQQNSNRNNIV